MTGIIVTGHGNFPTGILSAVELVAGKQENIAGIDFVTGQSSEELRQNLETAVNQLECDDILILADLAGGTPFNVSAVLVNEIRGKNVAIVAGVNMAVLVEAVFSRGCTDFKDLAALVKTAGKEGIVDIASLEGGCMEESETEEEGL